MNEIKASADYEPAVSASGMVKNSPDAPASKSDHEFRSQTRKRTSKPADMAVPPAEKVARQRDIAELHKRMVQMFTTLNEGLTATALAKAAKDREELCARLDKTELAVNSMEGLLRIEFAPQIRTLIHEEMDDHRRQQKTGWRPFFFWLSSSAAFLVAGTVFNTELTEFYNFLSTYILQFKDALLAN